MAGHVARVSERFAACIMAFADHPMVGEVRVRGLMGAIEFVADKETKAPFPPEGSLAAKVRRIAEERFQLIFRQLPSGDACAFAPPPIITEAEVDELFDRFGHALNRVRQTDGTEVTQISVTVSFLTVRRDPPRHALHRAFRARSGRWRNAPCTTSRKIGPITIPRPVLHVDAPMDPLKFSQPLGDRQARTWAAIEPQAQAGASDKTSAAAFENLQATLPRLTARMGGESLSSPCPLAQGPEGPPLRAASLRCQTCKRFPFRKGRWRLRAGLPVRRRQNANSGPGYGKAPRLERAAAGGLRGERSVLGRLPARGA